MARAKGACLRHRYGIGEWYGIPVAGIGPEERQRLSGMALEPKKPHLRCPWRSRPEAEFLCNKKGGVCTLRLYEAQPGDRGACPVSDTLCTVCPNRFYENDAVFNHIGEVVLSCEKPAVLSEIPFLEGTKHRGTGRDDVGKIDHVLVAPASVPLTWCALEMQAVYFSGGSMAPEFRALRESPDVPVPWPRGHRRPDYRSSGPKRLMPQLQIKVPTLRRWGKKLAVVVDAGFFSALAEMNHVSDLSNADIAWFVVKYEEGDDRISLSPGFIRFTTLESAVEGLTAGRPVSLEVFEQRIRAKLA